MKKLNMSMQINPEFTADDWCLYTSSLDCDGKAIFLNSLLKRLVNTGLDRKTVQNEMHAAMREMSYFGAADSEPMWFLEQVLHEIFGREWDDL